MWKQWPHPTPSPLGFTPRDQISQLCLSQSDNFHFSGRDPCAPQSTFLSFWFFFIWKGNHLLPSNKLILCENWKLWDSLWHLHTHVSLCLHVNVCVGVSYPLWLHMHNTDWHGAVLLDSFSTLFSLSEPAIHSLGYTEDQDWMVYVFPPLSSGVTSMWVIPDFYIHNEDT